MNQIKLVNSIIKTTITTTFKNTNNSSTILKNNIISKQVFKNNHLNNNNNNLGNNSIFNTNNSNNSRFTLGYFLITPTILFNSISNNNTLSVDNIKSYCTNTNTTTTNTTTNKMIDTMTITEVHHDASVASTSATVTEDCITTTIDATTITDTENTNTENNIVDQAMQDREMKSVEEQEEEEESDDINNNNNNNNIDNQQTTSSDDETTQIINNINNINNIDGQSGEGEFHLHSGICVIPHPNKRHKGGEDAYFISIDRQVIGVADGVGGWGDVGIDPSEYSNTLMEGSKIASDSSKIERDPLIIMEQGYAYSQDVKGSSTCCIVVMSQNKNLMSANLGDSGFLVIRNSEVIFRTREQQHAFNMPFQLGTQSIDRPIHSITASFPVEKGDLIIMGTDGVFDNLFDDEILEIGEKYYDDPQTIARQVAKRAFEVGCSTTIYTPFAKNAGHNGYIYNGGKLDDITVIVSVVDDGPIRPIKPDILLLDEEVSQ